MERESLPIVNVQCGKKTIYLLGTAHVSEESVQDVKYAIQTYKPDVVAVELDEAREKKLLKKDSTWQELDMFKVIKQKKAMFLLSSILLSSFQRRLGAELSVMPGAEMLSAIEESKTLDIPIVLADRPAEITLKRAWNRSSFWARQKIIAILITSIFYREKISEEEMQELKQKSLQGQVMDEITAMLPGLKSVLVDERDEYLAGNIMQAEGDIVLAVLGAAHVPGIKQRIEHEHNKLLSSKNPDIQQADTQQEADSKSDATVQQDTESVQQNTEDSQATSPTPLVENPQEESTPSPQKITASPESNIPNTDQLSTATKEKLQKRLKELDAIPPKRKTGIIGFIIPAVVLGLFGYGFYKGGTQSVAQNFILWWGINGGLSFLGALIALAHPATMVLSFLAAPLTSLNPFIGVGLVTGLSETFFRAPRVKDFEDLQSLSLSLKALYKNRVTRILLVLVGTTLGSAVGTFVGVSLLATNV